MVVEAHPKPDLILYVVSGAADRAIESLRELRDATTVQILAIGPRDPSLILGAVRAGAHDYLEQEGDLSVGLSAALVRISNSVRRATAVGQVTTVISASGGTGSTTVAANLAVALAKSHGRCGLFDFDLKGSDVATYLGLKPRHTVADLCRSVDKLDQRMWEQSLLEHDSGASILAGPESWDDTKYITGENLQKIVRFGRGMLPQIVADLDPFWLNDRAGLLVESTRIVLLFRLDFASIRNATRGAASAKNRRRDRRPAPCGQLLRKATGYQPGTGRSRVGREDSALRARGFPDRERVAGLRRAGGPGSSALAVFKSDRVARRSSGSRRGENKRLADRTHAVGGTDRNAAFVSQAQHSRMHAQASADRLTQSGPRRAAKKITLFVAQGDQDRVAATWTSIVVEPPGT